MANNNNPQGIWGKILNIDEEIRKNTKLAMGLVFIVMLGINWLDLGGLFRAINITITIIGFWKFYETAFKPTHLKYATITGAAWGVINKRNPADGIKEVMGEFGKLVNNVGFVWLLVGFTLSTWSFANNPVAFPIIVVGVLILTFSGVGNGWRAWIITAYAAVVIFVAIWSTFGDSWNGRSFDANTGAALHMVDPTTGKADPLGRTPSQCASQPCFSEESGAQLVPMSRDQALTRNVTAYPGLVLEEVTANTGMPGWLIVLIIGGVATALFFWSNKRVRPVIIAVLLVGGGWAGYTYAWPAVAAATVGCPGNFNASDDRITLRRGCTTEVTGFRQGNLLQVMDGRFDGDLNQYLDMPQPFPGYLRLTPNSGWPAGAEEIQVRVVTPAQAARETQPDTIVLNVAQ